MPDYKCPVCGGTMIEQDDWVRILQKDGSVRALDMVWCETCAEEYGIESDPQVK